MRARLLNLGARSPVGRLWSWLHARLFRATGGRVLGRWVGAPVLVIETVGRRSGKRRATPVIYAPAGDGFAVTPANAGAERTPAWWLNLRAAGSGEVVVGRRRMRVLLRVAQGEERDRLWRALAQRAPTIEEYPAFTDREFPIVVLEPDDG